MNKKDAEELGDIVARMSLRHIRTLDEAIAVLKKAFPAIEPYIETTELYLLTERMLEKIRDDEQVSAAGHNWMLKRDKTAMHTVYASFSEPMRQQILSEVIDTYLDQSGQPMTAVHFMLDDGEAHKIFGDPDWISAVREVADQYDEDSSWIPGYRPNLENQPGN